MDYFVGIDLHEISSQACTFAEDSKLKERHIECIETNFDEVFAGRASV